MPTWNQTPGEAPEQRAKRLLYARVDPVHAPCAQLLGETLATLDGVQGELADHQRAWSESAARLQTALAVAGAPATKVVRDSYGSRDTVPCSDAERVAALAAERDAARQAALAATADADGVRKELEQERARSWEGWEHHFYDEEAAARSLLPRPPHRRR